MYKELNKQVNKYIEICKQGKFFTDKNSRTMLKFYKHSKARNLSDARILSYFTRLKLSLKVIGNKDFEAWNKDDIEKLFTYIGNRKSNKGKEYSSWTRETMLNVLKAFFRWIYDTDDTPRILKGMKRERPPNTLTKEDLLTPDEIERMIMATNNVLYIGFIAMLTSGARPGEIYGIKLKDIHDESDFIKVYVGGTAGKMSKKLGIRAVYVQRFAEYLRIWLKKHPDKKNKEAWLFLKNKTDRIKYNSMRQIVEFLKNKAGIKKKVNPYTFRHSIATYLYGKYGTVYARRILGHSAGSRMEAVYCHLSETDIEDVLRGNKPMDSNGFDFGNSHGTEDRKKIFFKFFNENREQFLKMFEKWQKGRDKKL